MISSRAFFALVAVAFVMLPAGCIPTKQARVAAVALTMQDVAAAAAKQHDPAMVRQGTPAYLMLLDGLLEAYPDNRELLSAACQANSSYASSFLSDEDPKLSQAIYRKAKIYGFRSLSHHGDFVKAASGNLDEFRSFLEQYKKSDVPALFWTVSAWAGWVSVNIGGVEAMADLPALEAAMERVLQLDEAFYYGSPHLLMAVFLAAKPAIMGGDLSKAKRHFDRAFALGADKLLMAKVLFAQYYATGIKDRDLFVNTLREVVAAQVDTAPELTLANVLAQEKARRFLKKTEEYFGAQS